MSRALSVCHGAFGRASLYELDRPLIRHAHREAHLLFFLSGSPGQVQIGEHLFCMDRSTAVAVNPWESHGFLPNKGQSAGLFLIFYFNPEWLRTAMPDHPAQPGLFASPEVLLTPRLHLLRDEICQMLSVGVSDSLIFEACLIRLLEALGERRPQAESAGLRPFDANWGALDFRLRKSIAVLSPGLPTACTVASVARSSGLSRAHFFKLFREQLGLTPIVYVNALRIETALAQIARKETSIMTISDALGFSCQSAFTRFFASHVGMPPTDYRRAVQIAGTSGRA
jgi:AraC-like DNA-binding protein